MPKRPLIAAIDVGTNSFHLIIASINARGMIRIHSRDKETVRLGEGSGDMKYLSPDAMDRGILALKRFASAAEYAHAEIRAIGTSAVREALNKEEFLRRVQTETGVSIEVVSGNEEARLIYLGVLQALPIYDEKTLVIDIGGGSTETPIGYRGDLMYMHSAKLGAIRLTRRFFLSEKISSDEVRECRRYIRGEWSQVFRSVMTTGFNKAVGSSGTMETIFSVHRSLSGAVPLESMNGVEIDRKEILETISYIVKAKASSKRPEIPGLDPKRMDIIVAGALIVEQALLGFDIPKLTFSGYALREGILLDTYRKRDTIEKYHHLSRLRYETVLHLAEICQIDMAHAERVTSLAVALFDACAVLHKLSDVERELLEASALLHDVGYHISAEQHHKHTYYIIRNSTMLGFTNDESEIIANIARYHRKSHPKAKHENFMKVPLPKQRIVKILAGILRIAEGLDRRQIGAVKSVTAEILDKKIMIFVNYNSVSTFPDIEIWGAERKSSLLEEVFDRTIEFVAQPDTSDSHNI